MSFITLPPELLINIGDHLARKEDVGALAQTNRHLQQVYEPLLYGRGKQDTATADLRMNISRWASSHDKVEILNKLVKYGATFPTNESEAKQLRWPTMKYHPVFVAARKGHLEIVKFFLNRGFEVECRDSKGCSLFHLAATHNHKPIVDELIARKANQDSSNDDGLTVFDLADQRNMSAVMPALLEKGYDSNWNHSLHHRLCQAVFHRDADSVSFLLANGVSANDHCSYDSCKLSLAVFQSNWEICELLCDYGAILYGSLPRGSFPQWGLSPCKEDSHEAKERYPFVIQTVYHGHRAFHEMWDACDRCFALSKYRHNDRSLSRTADGFNLFSTAVGFNTLLCAAYLGKDGIAQGFLDRFPELEHSVPDAMVIAAFSHHNGAMSYFLSKGADPDYTLDGAVTALSHAGYHGWVSQVQLLLSAGASITLRDTAGKTAIWYAVQARRTKVLALYREHSPADFDAYENKMGLKRDKNNNVQDAGYCKTCSSWWDDNLNICMWWEYAKRADAVARRHSGRRTGIHDYDSGCLVQ
ncbi:ankyrin [Aspergillus aculeatinus CBS 121060]|uniref:Ankyrin n=1 Tax=Aspergillus aculeatinus CBS 121060 TaxID=1448322 RepID=A0ACD1HCH0_9EURO|nr:ankyrin [Aspergillus aculeatinus CBS 121060]RAH71345.1 ankyrin [Aspergillus aculeatinus CBS 121060]